MCIRDSGLLRVVGPAGPAVQHHVAVAVARRLDDAGDALLGDGEEGVRGAARAHRVDGELGGEGAATDGRSTEEFAQFELQVGRALLTFCIAPIVCGGLLAVLDLVATRRYSRKMASMFSEAYNQGYFDEGFVGLGFGMDASAWGDGGIEQGDL